MGSDEAAATLQRDYVLDVQVGYLLRLASQRHAAIFQRHAIDNLTPTQFSTLIRIAETGEVSQNHLGRLAAMDVATIKGVVDRLRAKGLVQSGPDTHDKRRSLISLTRKGRGMIAQLHDMGTRITDETLAPLSAPERRTLVALLAKISRES
ncbi:MarR family winged helix-turn-helix transcriptional regulator [Sulfitobacter sp. S190]|uniref:MarR family winged helix-turn-helix transcriptional regulator n=1 Tax=Sulfitobacter sp. S190 TaxID=2867022 RepID=UPI0021A5E662|nr:MarR family transcriptional regulator [Sulfitobacter sp. S190]